MDKFELTKLMPSRTKATELVGWLMMMMMTDEGNYEIFYVDFFRNWSSKHGRLDE
jgi:hypothetical protein